MKRKFIKKLILLSTLLIMILISVVAVVATDAAPQSYTVTIYNADGSISQVKTVKEGDTVTLKAENAPGASFDNKIYGWYDENGKLYSSNAVAIKSDCAFFEARGPEVKTYDALMEKLNKGYRYIKLGSTITLNETIKLPNEGLFTIDLNGYTLTMKTGEAGFTSMGCSVNIVDTSEGKNGKLNHTGVYTNADIMDSALFVYKPMLFKDATIRIMGAKVTTNVGLIDIVEDISTSRYKFTFDIRGGVEASFLVRTYGIKDATFIAHEKAEIKVIGSQAFEDRGDYNGINLTFEMRGGKLDLAEGAFVANELDKYNVFLTGGSYNRDLSNLYPNYSFSLNKETGYYELTGCKHKDVLTATDATCEEGGTVTYKCTLCGVERQEETGPIGHSGYRVLSKEAVTTPEKTEKGEYTTICQRCGKESKEYYYPLPNKVYVTLKILNEDGIEAEHRVLASTIFIFDKDNEITTLSTTPLETELGVEKKDIISVELPLGATIVPSKLFTDENKKYIQEVVLPESIEVIQSNAFKNMPALEKIIGIEYVKESIGDSAFEQASSTPLELNSLYINAKTIGARAFYNVTMTSLTFGENVNSIGSSAFGISEGVTSKMKEIFIEGNEDESFNYSTLSRYNNFKNCFSSLGSGHQFDSLGIVQVDHYSYIEGAIDNDDYWNVVPPTCQADGYTEYTCRNCGASGVTDVVPKVAHNFEAHSEKSTCQKQGYDGEKCTWCEETKVSKWYPLDPNTHDYTHSTTTSVENICENDYHIIGVCVCGAKAPPAEWIWQAKLGKHEMDESKVIDYKTPTCGEDGYSEYKCKHCTYTEKTIHRATGKHKLITNEKDSKAATCTETGIMAMVCETCSAVKKITTVIDETNHTWEKDKNGDLVWVTIVEPTDEKVGTAQNKCTGCGETQIKPIPVKTEASNVLTIVLIAVGAAIVLAAVGITLYFTVFRKNPSTSYKYKFNTLNKK